VTEIKNAASDDSVQPSSGITKAEIDWSDPSVPAGDAPPMPRWPLILSAVAYALWLCFLVAMAILRYQTTPV